MVLKLQRFSITSRYFSQLSLLRNRFGLASYVLRLAVAVVGLSVRVDIVSSATLTWLSVPLMNLFFFTAHPWITIEEVAYCCLSASGGSLVLSSD